MVAYIMWATMPRSPARVKLLWVTVKNEFLYLAWVGCKEPPWALPSRLHVSHIHRFLVTVMNLCNDVCRFAVSFLPWPLLSIYHAPESPCSEAPMWHPFFPSTEESDPQVAFGLKPYFTVFCHVILFHVNCLLTPKNWDTLDKNLNMSWLH